MFIPSQQTEANTLLTHLQAFCQSNKHQLFDATLSTNAAAVIRQKVIETTNEMKQTDGIIFEASQPDFNLGKYLTLAIQFHKPILLLYQSQLPTEFITEQSRLISTKEYSLDNLDQLSVTLRDFTKLMNQQRLLYRFNLMISKDLNSYLMDKAREKSVSKADYIRQLIVNDMETVQS